MTLIEDTSESFEDRKKRLEEAGVDTSRFNSPIYVIHRDEDGNRIDPVSGEIIDDPKKDYVVLDKDGNAITPDEVQR
jgi:hypothetical protein